MLSLFQTCKNALFKTTSKELLYLYHLDSDYSEIRERLKEIDECKKFVNGLRDNVSKRTRAAIKIQRQVRKRLLGYKLTTVFPCTIHRNIILTQGQVYNDRIANGCSVIERNNKKILTLYCSDMYFYDFLNPKFVKKINKIGHYIFIYLDRYAIRHCYDRHLKIDTITKDIHFVETCPNTHRIIRSNTLKREVWF